MGTDTKTAFKYGHMPLEKGSVVEKYNVLTVEIMPNQLTQTASMA